ncbi:9318_t:CDS:1, partial [Paraglomus brasilianum]
SSQPVAETTSPVQTSSNVPAATVAHSEANLFRCTVDGCPKKYKNANGLKYHRAHGHSPRTDNGEKPYKCQVDGCTKSYRNPNGLKYHLDHHHSGHNVQITNNTAVSADQKISIPQ